MKNLALVLLVIVCLVWGSTFVIVKNVVDILDASTLVLYRSLLAAIPMLFVVLFQKKWHLLKDKALLKQGALIGFFLFGTYYIQSIAIQHTSAGHSAFITGSAVILVPLLLFLFFKNKILPKGWVASILVFGGLAMLSIGEGGGQQAIDPIKGDLLTFGAAIVCALHIIYSGKYAKTAALMPLIFLQFFFCSLAAFLATLYHGTTLISVELLQESSTSILYLGFIGTLFCYFVFVWGQKYVNSISVALIFSLEPVFAGIMAWYYNNEQMGTREILGAVIMMIGILLYESPIRLTRPKQNDPKL